MKTVPRILLTIASTCLVPASLLAQSQTTGTLNLRNAQPETVSLSIPSTGVTGYKVLLPPTIGLAGQSMGITTINGTTAELGWSDAAFWQLAGTSVTSGGTAPGQQYLGSSNEQDLVLAANGDEAIRIVGVAGTNQSFIGIGTSTPQAPLDIAGHMLLSNSGAATELRFAEPTASGSDYTAFRAGPQTASITYTLPPDAPSSAGVVLSSSTTGDLSWQKPLFSVPMGLFTPVVGSFQHTINVGVGVLTVASVPVVTILNDPGTTIGISVTNRDVTAGTITVETSVPLSNTDRISWVVFTP